MSINIHQLASGCTGVIHLMAAIVAIALGTLSLWKRKGTVTHKKIGYAYTGAMLVMLITAFMLYNLFGSWGMFHWAAVVSTLTLAAGMIPIWINSRHAVALHFSFMYWSIIGLYGAFISEVLVRVPRVVVESGIPTSTFYSLIGLGVGITLCAGAIGFIKFSPARQQQFSSGQKVSHQQ